jgi:hypothetical protein
MIQLGFQESCLYPNEERDKKRDALIERIKKRKNNINKYYEINIHMMDRFIMAQRELHCNNYSKALALLNLSQMPEELENIQVNKVSLNIFNSLATSNTGVIHLLLGKPTLSLYYFKKAKDLLQKISASPDDR